MAKSPFRPVRHTCFHEPARRGGKAYLRGLFRLRDGSGIETPNASYALRCAFRPQEYVASLAMVRFSRRVSPAHGPRLGAKCASCRRTLRAVREPTVPLKPDNSRQTSALRRQLCAVSGVSQPSAQAGSDDRDADQACSKQFSLDDVTNPHVVRSAPPAC